ncbi:MAG: lactonase family protein [Verrucomicrobiales bacterium]|nr:lactonase family protein [Verrucomicrobiales bacterium]
MKLFLYLITPALLLVSVRAQPIDVYFGTGGKGADGIFHATFHPETGKLSSATRAAEITSPGFLAMHPKGETLYAVASVEKEGGVAAYRPGDDGALEFMSFVPTGDGGGAHIAVHPTGKFLLTAQYGGGSVALFPLDEEGNPGEPGVIEHEGGSGVVEKRQDSPHPHWCGFSPDGKYALVPDLGMDGIVIYKVDEEKPSITAHGFAASVPGGGPRHMRFSTDGKFIYLLNELSLSVTTFAWDAEKGSAEKLSTTPALSEEAKAGENFNSAAEILVHPSGEFVYSSNRGHDTVSVYAAEKATGELSVIQVQPIRGAFPRNINLSPDANWLLAAGADSNTIAVHALDAETGKLTYQRGHVINVPSPICILFAP